MNKYTNKLNELYSNFSYPEFASLLKEIDDEIINGEDKYFDPEFIYYFNRTIRMVNDKYIVDGNLGTLGHLLVENALLNKEKLTPTLIMCFFLEQKHNLGLDNDCNKISFVHLNSGNYNMKIDYNHDTGKSDASINWKHYANLKRNVDEFNYELMFATLHELTHVYQFTRTEETENIFDRLAYYDSQKARYLIGSGGANTNLFFHQALLSEFMADEQAHIFMLQLAQNHPEYFNDELIENKKTIYKNRKDGVYKDFGSNPRQAFANLLSEIKYTYDTNKEDPSFNFIPPMLEKIEDLENKSKPLIDELQRRGISEKGTDSYYSIYLKSTYRFDKENNGITNTLQDDTTKGSK